MNSERISNDEKARFSKGNLQIPTTAMMATGYHLLPLWKADQTVVNGKALVVGIAVFVLLGVEIAVLVMLLELSNVEELELAKVVDVLVVVGVAEVLVEVVEVDVDTLEKMVEDVEIAVASSIDVATLATLNKAAEEAEIGSLNLLVLEPETSLVTGTEAAVVGVIESDASAGSIEFKGAAAASFGNC